MRKINKSIYACTAIVISMIILTGCTKDHAPIQPEQTATTSPSVASASISVTFTPVAGQDLLSMEPKQAKEVSKHELGEVNHIPVTLEFYSDDPDPQAQGSTYGYLKYKNKSYAIGDVTSTYGFSSVKINNIARDDLESGLVLPASVGTPYLETQLIGYDLDSKKFVMWNLPGEVKYIHFMENTSTLAAVFEGVHLNPPNVYLLSVRNNQLEQADVGAALQANAVRVVSTSSSFNQLEATRNNTTQYYIYEGGKLVSVTK